MARPAAGATTQVTIRTPARHLSGAHRKLVQHAKDAMSATTPGSAPSPAGTPLEVRHLTPVLIVDAIEPCLGFWTERLGFHITAEVPDGTQLGFVILQKGGVELMYQTRQSILNDAPGSLPTARGHSTALFLEVADVDAVERALLGVPVVVPRRRTFYGMDEIGVKEPGGHVVIFAQPLAK
jgi:hypothetical protein